MEENDRKLWNICVDIYREMYSKSTPSADFDKLISDGETKNKDWFLDYYLDAEEQQRIINKHIIKNNLKRSEKVKISVTVNIGCAPRGYKNS